jgi:hypothetical protein
MQLYVVVPCWYRCHRCRCRCGCGAGCGCGHRAGGGVCWASSSQLPYSVLCSSSSSCRRCDLCCGCATRPTPAATVPAGGGGRGRRRAAAAAAPRSSGRARRLAVASFVDLAVRLLCVHCTALRVHIVLHVDSCTIDSIVQQLYFPWCFAQNWSNWEWLLFTICSHYEITDTCCAGRGRAMRRMRARCTGRHYGSRQ